GARAVRELRFRCGLRPPGGSPEGAGGRPGGSIVASRVPPFATPWSGIAYTGTPGTRASYRWAGISPHGSGSDTGPRSNVQATFPTKKSCPNPKVNAPRVASQFRVHREGG